MEASRGLPLVPRVQLHQKYWVTEDSKAKLLEVGARCLDVVTETEHYYDTVSDELATAQLWLSKRNQQWRLIVESQKQTAEEDATGSVAEIWEPPRQGKTDNASIYKGAPERKPAEKERDLNEEYKIFLSVTSSSIYAEVADESEIITYLADFLHVDLKNEKEGNVGMEDFLQKAAIQHYASNHTVRQATYKLGRDYTIVTERDESSLRETATVHTEVDISNICKGFEEIEKLATYLGFVQSQPGFKTDSYDPTPL